MENGSFLQQLVYKKGNFRSRDTHMGRISREHEDADQGNVSINQGTPEIAHKPVVASGEACTRSFPKAFRGITALLTPGFQTSLLHNCETINFCPLSHSVCVALLQPRELIHPPETLLPITKRQRTLFEISLPRPRCKLNSMNAYPLLGFSECLLSSCTGLGTQEPLRSSRTSRCCHQAENGDNVVTWWHFILLSTSQFISDFIWTSMVNIVLPLVLASDRCLRSGFLENTLRFGCRRCLLGNVLRNKTCTKARGVGWAYGRVKHQCVCNKDLSHACGCPAMR